MIAKEAEQYAAALEDGDWEELLKLTNEEIIETNGGSRTMVAQSEAFEAEMQQRGFTLKKVELAEPREVLESGEYLMSVVPMRLTFDGPLGKLYSESGILAVSADDGQTWSFIDLAQVQVAQLAEIFPELNPGLEFPVKRIYQE